MEKKYYFRGLGLGIIVTAVIMGIALPGGTKKREMTDDEVIARAKELGMIEDSRLLEPTGEDPDSEDAAAEPEEPVRKDIALKAEAEAAAGKTDEAKVPDPSGTAPAAAAEQKPTVDTPEPAQTVTSAASSETRPKPDTNEMTKQDDDVSPAPDAAEGDDDADPVPGGTGGNRGTNQASAAGTKSVTIVGGDGSYTVAKKLETAGLVSSAASYDTYLCEHGYDKKLRTGTFQIPEGATDEQIARIVTGQ